MKRKRGESDGYQNAIKEANQEHSGSVWLTSKPLGHHNLSTLIEQKVEKLYLILILLSPLHLRWGVGQVLWTFIKLMFHRVDGMATRKRKVEEKIMLKIINACVFMLVISTLTKADTVLMALAV